MAAPLRRAVFLDRDGVINENRADYVKSWDEMEFIDGSLEALAALARTDLVIIVVTNQSVVGRGIMTEAEAAAINARMREVAMAHGGRIDRVYMCTDHPDTPSNDRKPAPGMLLRGAEEFGIDLTASWMIGDAVTDLQAGISVGASIALLLTGRGTAERRRIPPEIERMTAIYPDLRTAVAAVLEELGARA